MIEDPISYDWHLLDKDIQQRLTGRKFVSMKIERLLEIPSSKEELENYLRDSTKQGLMKQEIAIGNVHYEKALTYITGSSHDVNSVTQAQNGFAAGMPGILSLKEVEESIDLDKWRLRLYDMIVRLQVSRVDFEPYLTKLKVVLRIFRAGMMAITMTRIH